MKTRSHSVSSTPPNARTVRRMAVACALAALLAGCQTVGAGSPSGPDLDTRLHDADVMSEVNGNVVAKAAYWGGLYEQDPRDAEAAAEYASALRAVGSTAAAIDVLRRAESLNPDDPRILAEYGKTLTSSGRAAEALPVFDKALAVDPDNWRTLSAQGVALDQVGQHDAARAVYRAAIAAAPGEPTPWNNLGMSYALTNDLKDAELAMRKAVSTPRATGKMRQNLALVLGLRGDYTDAERLASAPTAPAAISGDAEKLRAIVTQPALWAREANADNNPVIIE
ncbi:MAG: tetratricopeptide repeat protein [Pyruvatibacter sp.]